MNLAEAIRKGCEQVSKSEGKIFQSDENNNIVGACVIGAAAIGITGISKWNKEVGVSSICKILNDYFPELEKMYIDECPQCHTPVIGSLFTRPLNDMMVHLNDQHYWTREAIADWIDETQQRGGV